MKKESRHHSISETSLILEPWERRFTSMKDVHDLSTVSLLLLKLRSSPTSWHVPPHTACRTSVRATRSQANSSGSLSSPRAQLLSLYKCIYVLVCYETLPFQTYYTISNYLSYKTTIEMQLLFEAAPFPAVTICNLNPFKFTRTLDHPDLRKSVRKETYQCCRTHTRLLQLEIYKLWINRVQHSPDDEDYEVLLSEMELNRNKRQLHYTPYYAKCSCPKGLYDVCTASR